MQSTAYWFKYKLNLFSNFTYFLDDPENGDQFEQADDRNVYGWTGSWSKTGELFGAPTRNTLGFELRQDRIDPVGLYSTRQRERLSTTREDDVVEGSAGVYAQNDTQWNDWFRSLLGIRYDRYRFDVDASVAENSGNVTSGITSPKASLVFGPWYKTEYFRQCRLRLPQQRRARCHDQGRPEDRAIPSIRRHRSCAARGRNWACAPKPSPTSSPR